MKAHSSTQVHPVAVDRAGVQTLIDVLAGTGYRIMGPTVRDGAIIYDDVASVDDFPVGWTDRQDAGHYRIERRDDEALFGFAVGPHSWKRFLHPPIERLFAAVDTDIGVSIVPGADESRKLAFIGVRACELHAIAIQDRVFCEGRYIDRRYAQRRRDVFIVAVNCSQAGGTCFCASMGTGPAVDSGFDLALTELPPAAGEDFVVEVGSDAGAALVEGIPHRPATAAHLDAARAVVEQASGQMGRAMQTDGIKSLLQDNPNHPRWDDVADRCLSCGNCTMVCPTCFCTTVEDHGDLAGTQAERVRKWDSCFTLDFSHLHGGSVRHTAAARYRQWLTHKLASWIDQFGTSGCVGCGRCITWCPVGIDITEEVAAIRGSSRAAREEPDGRA
ncbi:MULTISPECIES: 4Fe-4S dicluster domain-containing protein [Burkholderia]|uniref:Sulfite reductase subunit A n=1 Tax=Burkholderia savannae TaxID=1637837 RepID=A0ABR5T8P8_9BURK|nr:MULTISPECIES: 4Fe-4S dicluster domain-containing protein [Burkholderia]AOJ73397.1 sulfite reductase subunit A [Burkholderia savannae]KVG48264.1 sulfite reductase subunit A [Burkholderia sp. MSMB0265]KVG84341.1 sulfite reductase subunit A [Burkholderia sp. MSMB2040]KVG92159.1 sulfite reductase subunit A [Burkholderia sp. MSMB2042]KVG93918.1 sulfite reductase subunit A [Burkholderia sp. MSMB2041]